MTYYKDCLKTIGPIKKQRALRYKVFVGGGIAVHVLSILWAFFWQRRMLFSRNKHLIS